MRKQERVVVSQSKPKVAVRSAVPARQVVQARTAVRGTILARQVKTAKPSQRVKVSACNSGCDSSTTSSGNNNNSTQCQPIDFSGCDCTSIDLGCLNSTSNIDQTTGLNRDIQTALGLPADIADCLSSTCGTAVTADQIHVADIPTLDKNPTRNGSVSSRIRIFTVTDACGQSATLVRTVTFQETSQDLIDPSTGLPINVGPIVTCSQDRTVSCGTTADEIRFDTPFFTSACGPCNIDVTPALNSPFYDSNIDTTSTDAFQNTTYTRTWTATDACNNSTSCTQTITVLCHPEVPTGCDVTFWKSSAGQALLADATGPLRIALHNLGIPLTDTSTNSDIFSASVISLLGNATTAQTLSGEYGDCSGLLQQAIVAFLNIASAQAFPGNFPHDFQFPTGSTDIQSLLALVNQTVVNEFNTGGNQGLCSELATELQDVNSLVCNPNPPSTCTLAYWQTSAGQSLFTTAAQPLATLLGFTSTSPLSTVFPNLQDPKRVLTGVFVNGALAGGQTAAYPCLSTLLQESLVTILNAVAYPTVALDFTRFGVSTVTDLPSLETYVTSQLNTFLTTPSPTCTQELNTLNANLIAANDAFCAQVPPPAAGLKGLRKALQPKLYEKVVRPAVKPTPVITRGAPVKTALLNKGAARPVRAAQRCYNPK
jgi:hypothetical protein